MKSKLLLAVATLAIFGAGQAAPGSQRLYAAATSSNELYVIDIDTHQIIQSVTVGAHPHGVAVSGDGRWIWVATSGDGRISKIDAATGVKVGSWELGPDQQELEITNDGRLLYTGRLREGCYDVFDTVKEKVIAQIPVDGNPHNVAKGARNDRYIYASPLTVDVPTISRNLMEKNRSSHSETIAAAQKHLEQTPFKNCDGSINKHFVPNNKIYVIDTKTQKIAGTIPTGTPPRPIALTEDGKNLYANVDGLIGFLVIDTATRKVTERVVAPLLTDEQQTTPSRSHGIGVTRDQREVWSTSVNHGYIHVYDRTGKTMRFISQIALDGQPYWLTFSPDGQYAYAALPHQDKIAVIDVKTHEVGKYIQLPKGAGVKTMQAEFGPGGP